MTTVSVQSKMKAKRMSAMMISINVGTMLNRISCRLVNQQSSIMVVEVRTSRVRLIAAPLSRILSTSPVLRRT